ncbi:MAG TPA: nuclear transport factor 2 family protein [Cyclobacteriaceae bacterium]|jgi:hypothetical protein|nr:nuclear transport factor 2 family protein [Cyclobacteriaceae bacterium]
MKFLLVIICLISVSAYAQKDEADVAKSVETLNQAIIDGKKAALENITADELTYGHSNGLVEDKATFVQTLVSGASDFVTIVTSEQVIRVIGNTATVRHKLVAETNNNNVPGKANIAVLLVFLKVKGEWKLLARQAVKV